MKKSGIAFLLVLVLQIGNVYAAGLAIPEQGAAALGLSASMTARSQDLSAIYYNPAGMDYVTKGEAYVGLTPIQPVHQFEGTGESADAKKKTYMIPQIYAAYRMHPRLVMGLGIYTPYGLGTDWGDTWVGRYTSTYAEVQSLYINPSASFQVTKWLTLGAGFSFVYSSAVIEKMVDSGLAMYSSTKNAGLIGNTYYDSKFRLDGEGGGMNWNLGLMPRPSEKMQLGVSYRSKTDVDYTGTIYFDHKDLTASALLASMPTMQDGKTTLHLPGVFSAGLLYNLNDRWDASFDVNFVEWSSYNKLVIDLEKELPKAQMVQSKKWENTQTYRLGSTFDWSDLTVLRCGIMYDQTPVPDATFDAQLPDNDRIGFSVGVGRKIGQVTIDAGYLFLKFFERDKDNYVGYSDVNSDGVVDAKDQKTLAALKGGTEYPVAAGTYKSYVNMLSLSASIKF